MTGLSNRVIALMTALMLLLVSGAALAEAPKEIPTPMKVLEAGGAASFEGSIRVDSASLKSLLMLFSGGAPDEAETSVMDNVLSALNKLNFRLVNTKNAASGVLGTEAGELINFQAAVKDEASAENVITTNLLPGVALSMDPSVMKKLLDQQVQMDPAQMEEMLMPYAEAFMSFFAGKIGPKQGESQETYDIEGVGQFQLKEEFSLTGKDIAELMEKLLEMYKKDQKLQEFVKKSSAAGQMTGAQDPMDPKEVEEEIAEMKKSGDEPVINGTVYASGDGNKLYAVLTDGQEKNDTRVRVTVLADHDAMGKDVVKVKVLTKSNETDDDEEGADKPAEPIDWANVEADIMAGKSMSDVLVQVDFETADGEAALTSALKISAMVMGMNVRVELDGSSQKDKLNSDAMVRIYMNAGADGMPLVSLSGKITESADMPMQPSAEERKVVTLKMDEKGDMAVSDKTTLKESLKKGLPVLMENLNKALPEEGPALVMLLNQALGLQDPPAEMPAESEAPAAPANP